MKLYGLYGITHGFARTLTVMSPDGAGAVLSAVEADPEDVSVRGGNGRLPQYHEKRDGGLERLVARNAIRVLEKREWDAKKAALGERIFG